MLLKNGSKYTFSKATCRTDVQSQGGCLTHMRPPTHKQVVGNLGEDIACRCLEWKGYRIIERNFRRKWGEIDIIAQKDKIVHFIEVKTVSDFGLDERSIDLYQPEDNLHPRKLKRLARAVATYLAGLNDSVEWQFDAIAVFLDRDTKRARVRVLEDLVL